jgi:Bacterial Ig-like domain
MGNPLKKGNWYTLVVSNEWKDVQGLSLPNKIEKKFFVEGRDSRAVEIASWNIQPPGAGTNQALLINFGESLDYFLLGETISIINDQNETIAGEIKITDTERKIAFAPQQPWKKGNYRIQVKAILEDLAGNNLNRPFDRDTKTQKQVFDKDVFEREFVISD